MKAPSFKMYLVSFYFVIHPVGVEIEDILY